MKKVDMKGKDMKASQELDRSHAKVEQCARAQNLRQAPIVATQILTSFRCHSRKHAEDSDLSKAR